VINKAKKRKNKTINEQHKFQLLDQLSQKSNPTVLMSKLRHTKKKPKCQLHLNGCNMARFSQQRYKSIALV